MNKILKIREKINRSIRLYEGPLLATINGEITPYKISVFEERISQIQIEIN